MLVTIGGCDRNGTASKKDSQENRTDSEGDSEIRIVSLSPALTRIAVDLGFGDLIVGRTRYCKSVDLTIPVIGDHFAQDFEALVRVKPTHILIQPPRNEISSSLSELAQAKGWVVASFKIDSLDDIKSVTQHLPAEIFANDSARLHESNSKASELLKAIDEITLSSNDQAWRGSVLLVHSIKQSISIFGKGTYLDELLASFGCTNAAQNVTGWAQLTLEDVVRLNPDAIVIITSTIYSDANSRQALGVLRELTIDAVRENRVGILSHTDALLPATSVIEVAAQLGELLNSFASDVQ